ncbi:MAG: hypothetical protein ACOYXC_20100 [Candidatus Rifleibacteriota bacterium]
MTDHYKWTKSGLFSYIFAFVLLTLHAPYCYLIIRHDLRILPDGSIDYDLGGLFPYTAAGMAALFFQTGAVIFIYLAALASARLFQTANAFSVAFGSIMGLQVIVYTNIYLISDVDARIMAAMGSFSISWFLLAFFVAYSLWQLHVSEMLRREEPEMKEEV